MTDKYKIIVTGARDWTDAAALWKYLDDIAAIVRRPLLIRHGAASKGADAMCDEWAIVRGHAIERFPADWRRHASVAGRNPAGVIRNTEMAKIGADLCVAFPTQPEIKRGGTWDMVRKARGYVIPILVYPEPASRVQAYLDQGIQQSLFGDKL